MVSISGDNTNLRFDKNIVHGTADADTFVSRCVYIGSGNTEVAGMDRNLYFQEDDRQIILFLRQSYGGRTGYQCGRVTAMTGPPSVWWS